MPGMMNQHRERRIERSLCRYLWSRGKSALQIHRTKQTAVMKAFWDKFDFLYPLTSQLPAITYTSIGKNNDDSKASGEKRKNKNDFIAIFLVM